jgi:hypothetical protein
MKTGKSGGKGRKEALMIGKVLLSTFLFFFCLTISGVAAEKHGVLGKERIIAFLYLPKEVSPETLRSANLIQGKADKWKYWSDKGVVICQGKTWFDLMRNPVEKAVEILTTLDYGGNPEPVVCIDEFGFDFGGQADRKTAAILKETKRRKPELRIVVWHMRGPISPALAEAYRQYVDLILPEAYVGGSDDYWQIITQARAAQLQGLAHKTLIALGLGLGGNPGETWAVTKKELEQQVRFLRLIAPDAPGIAFYSAGIKQGEPGLIEYADELAGKIDQIPANGAGLPKKTLDLYEKIYRPGTRPLIVASGLWAEPDRSSDDPGKLVQPKTMRALLMNLGDKDAADVKVRLRNPKDKGGDVFAEGITNVPGKGVAVAVLPVTAKWNVWKTWDIEVDGGGAEVLVYPRDK